MNIALIGATGYVGRHLLLEAQLRGHAVTAIARRIDDIPVHAGTRRLALDISDGAGLVAALRGHDAVIVSLKSKGLDVEALLRAVRESGVPRLLAVGGAGSLQVAPGLDLVDAADMKPQWKPEALAARDFLHRLRNETALDWTLLSPSALLVPGERTGRFRIGQDELLRNAEGESGISLQDLAFAMWDEVEQARFSRRRFTVGY